MSDTPPALSPSQKPVGVDPDRPSIARIYDGFLGGNNFYEVDRVVMEKIRSLVASSSWLRNAIRSAIAFIALSCRSVVLDPGTLTTRSM